MSFHIIFENPNCGGCGFRMLSVFETQSFRCSNCDTHTPWPGDAGATTPPDTPDRTPSPPDIGLEKKLDPKHCNNPN